MFRSKAGRVSILLLLIAVLAGGACSSERAPTVADRDHVSAAGQLEIEAHRGDPWVSAFDHQSLTVQREWVTPRRFDREDGRFGPSYFETATEYEYIYHPVPDTTDLETVHSELVGRLEVSGASILEFEPFENTPGDGPVVSTEATATLSVDSLGDSLTIILTYVEFAEDNGTDFIRHTVLINDSSG